MLELAAVQYDGSVLMPIQARQVQGNAGSVGDESRVSENVGGRLEYVNLVQATFAVSASDSGSNL